MALADLLTQSDPGTGPVPEVQSIDKLASQAQEIIQEAHDDVAGSFDQVSSSWKRKSVRQLVATDPAIEKAEAAILKQYRTIMESPNQKEKELAFERIKQGMVYWKSLIMKRIQS
jgi:uncharacterized protein YukE